MTGRATSRATATRPATARCVGGRHRRRRRDGRRSRLERRQHGLGARRRRNRRRADPHPSHPRRARNRRQHELRGAVVAAAKCGLVRRLQQEADGHSLLDESVRLARLGDRALRRHQRHRHAPVHLRRAAVRPTPARPILRAAARRRRAIPPARTGHNAHRRAAAHVHHRPSQRLKGARRHPFELVAPPHLAPPVELAPVPPPAAEEEAEDVEPGEREDGDRNLGVGGGVEVGERARRLVERERVEGDGLDLLDELVAARGDLDAAKVGEVRAVAVERGSGIVGARRCVDGLAAGVAPRGVRHVPPHAARQLRAVGAAPPRRALAPPADARPMPEGRQAEPLLGAVARVRAAPLPASAAAPHAPPSASSSSSSAAVARGMRITIGDVVFATQSSAPLVARRTIEWTAERSDGVGRGAEVRVHREGRERGLDGAEGVAAAARGDGRRLQPPPPPRAPRRRRLEARAPAVTVDRCWRRYWRRTTTRARLRAA